MVTRSNYSFASYCVAVDIRESKTILVEGVSDRKILKRSFASDRRAQEANYVIDTAQMLQSSAGQDRMGNKCKALEVSRRMFKNDKFAVFIDREWDGLIDTTNDSWLPYSPANSDGLTRIFTSGHSIENYSFVSELYCQSILSTCFEYFGENNIPELEACFDAALRMGLAFSGVFRRWGLLGRCTGCVRPTDFSWREGGKLEISDATSFSSILEERGCTLPEGFKSELMQEYVAPSLPKEAPIQFYLHGHFGEEVLRAALCAKIVNLGVPEETSLRFFSENNETREQRLRDFYANLQELPRSISMAVEFLSR